MWILLWLAARLFAGAYEMLGVAFVDV